jgi:hypothetical protein
MRRSRKEKKRIRKRRKDALTKYQDIHTPKKSNFIICINHSQYDTRKTP